MTLTRLTAFLAMCILCLGLWGCSSAPVAAPVPAAPAATAEGAPAVAVSLASYKLGAGDRLRVSVFNEEALSGEFLVDGTGMVSMPLIGEVFVEGLTVRDFQRKFEEELESGDFLIDARVSAEVLNYRPYYILGEVENPGEYPYSAGLSVMNAVATAGGFTYRANKRNVFVRSGEGGDEVRVRLTPSTKLQPGDTIRIGERIF